MTEAEKIPHKIPLRPSEATYKFEYKNHRGEVAIRYIMPIHTWFGTSEYHPEFQMFLRAFDFEKEAERDFAVRDIIRFIPRD